MISIIAAMDNDRVIGNNNSLPWNLPADMKRFKNLTAGKPIIMGSKTFESIGKALPDRDNIVLTDDENYKAPGCKLAYSIEQAVSLAQQSPAFQKHREIMICGGASVYGQFLDRADRMYLTIIDHKFKGDAFFPEFDQSQWQEKENIRHEPDENNRYHYSFLTLDRKT
jgi:dihydrofolate reductase